MYKTSKIVINKTEHPEIFELLTRFGLLSTNLYNAGLFRVRQNFTMRGKETLQPLEMEALGEIKRTITEKNLGKPGRCMSYKFLEKLMRVTESPDFFAGLPMHTAQYSIKQACTDFRNWLKACRTYKKDPSAFLGPPKMPKYKKKKLLSTFTLSNQASYIFEENGMNYLKFPFLNDKFLPVGPISGTLKQVEVKPYYDTFIVICVLEVEDELPVTGGFSCGIDLGVDNIAAIVSNNGSCLLYKGNVLKSVNQWYNKQTAHYRSIAMKGHSPKEATKLGLLDTKMLNSLSRNRSQFLNDALHKISSDIVKFCADSEITTIVIGKNKNWKQESNMGKTNNQNFVQLPLETLRFMITYKAEAVGITVHDQEESYTSKASFLDNDYIPKYGVDDEMADFSGSRIKKGLYRCGDGTIINADLNGAGNILRKHTPDAFENVKNFSFLNNIIVRNYKDLNKRIPVEGIEAA